MKFLAWYTIVLVALVQIYVLGEVIDGYEAAGFGLFVIAAWSPPIIFGVKSLLKK